MIEEAIQFLVLAAWIAFWALAARYMIRLGL